MGPKPHVHMPYWIVAWVMDKCVSSSRLRNGAFIGSRCDDKDIDGSTKDHSTTRSNYVHAQKMRAAMTHFFGREPSIGNTWWHQNDDGSVFGNPSLSHVVSTYMISLRRRKVS